VRDFVRSCVQTFIAGHFAPGIEGPGIFDGIDIDWEYPVEGGVHQGHPEDKANFAALAAEFRRQLDALRPGYLLTAALPAEEEYYKNFELKEISRYLDYISIMAYDLHWNTEPTTNFHSALFHDAADPSTAPLDKRYGDPRAGKKDRLWSAFLWQRVARRQGCQSRTVSDCGRSRWDRRELSRIEGPAAGGRSEIFRQSSGLQCFDQFSFLVL
jgi:hypothetical protein